MFYYLFKRKNIRKFYSPYHAQVTDSCSVDIVCKKFSCFTQMDNDFTMSQTTSKALSKLKCGCYSKPTVASIKVQLYWQQNFALSKDFQVSN